MISYFLDDKYASSDFYLRLIKVKFYSSFLETSPKEKNGKIRTSYSLGYYEIWLIEACG